MEALFHWRTELETGVGEIDDQHRFLVDLVNHYFDAVERGIDVFIIDDMVTCLRGYVHTHFHLEEKMMRESAYPRYEEHLQEHRDLTERVENLTVHLEIDYEDLKDLGIFLKNWLETHIQQADRDFTRHFRLAAGARATAVAGGSGQNPVAS